METPPPRTPEESDPETRMDDRNRRPRPQREVRDRDERGRVVEPELVRDGVRNGAPRMVNPYPTYEGIRTVPAHHGYRRVRNEETPASPKTVRVDADGRMLDPRYYGTHGPLPRFCFRLQVHPGSDPTCPASRLFTRAIIHHQVNMFLGTRLFPLATEVTPLDATNALVWPGKRCNNEGWLPDEVERMDAHFSRWDTWMGKLTRMVAITLPVKQGRCLLANAQHEHRAERTLRERQRENNEREERLRRTTAAAQLKKSRKGASPRSSRGLLAPRTHPARCTGRLPARHPLPDIPNTSSVRAAVTRARMTRQFKYQERETPRGQTLAESPESPDPDDDSESAGEDEEETVTETEAYTSASEEDEAGETDTGRERTPERARWAKSYSRKSPGVWELRSPRVRPPRPRPYGAHAERRQPVTEKTHHGYKTDWGPRVPTRTRKYLDDLELPFEETPSVLEERGENFSPHKKTRRSHRWRDAAAGRTSRRSGSGSDSSHRSRDRDRSPRGGCLISAATIGVVRTRTTSRTGCTWRNSSRWKRSTLNDTKQGRSWGA